MGGFDFDHWKHLAERDPESFFQARDEALRDCIARHPDQAHVLSALQARIDATRVLAGTPLHASRALMGMMHEQLRELGDRLVELQQETDALRALMVSSSP
ncbi:MAG: DUF3135 domain-containing protein [Aquabacterium sp.]|nr:DUF3135 domain-containing protein [Aquabacterium sp.]